MGTRADFYMGTGPEAEWLGSVGWDGYEWAEDEQCPLRQASTAAQFRDAVAVIAERDDFTSPSMGWPWPWEDSRMTDYAYAWSEEGVIVTCFNSPAAGWPDMSQRMKIALDGRSGLLIFPMGEGE